jgi:hypothetical protein
MRAAKKNKREKQDPLAPKKKQERSSRGQLLVAPKKTERERRGREHLMHPTINAD